MPLPLLVLDQCSVGIGAPLHGGKPRHIGCPMPLLAHTPPPPPQLPQPPHGLPTGRHRRTETFVGDGISVDNFAFTDAGTAVRLCCRAPSGCEHDGNAMRSSGSLHSNSIQTPSDVASTIADSHEGRLEREASSLLSLLRSQTAQVETLFQLVDAIHEPLSDAVSADLRFTAVQFLAHVFLRTPAVLQSPKSAALTIAGVVLIAWKFTSQDAAASHIVATWNRRCFLGGVRVSPHELALQELELLQACGFNLQCPGWWAVVVDVCSMFSESNRGHGESGGYANPGDDRNDLDSDLFAVRRRQPSQASQMLRIATAKQFAALSATVEAVLVHYGNLQYDVDSVFTAMLQLPPPVSHWVRRPLQGNDDGTVVSPLSARQCLFAMLCDACVSAGVAPLGAIVSVLTVALGALNSSECET